MAILFSSVILITMYSLAYSNLVIQHLPVGWDTPNYVNSIIQVKAGNIWQVIERYDYVNFLYYLIASLIPLGPLTIEIYLPVVMGICVVAMFGVFTKTLTGDQWIAGTAIIFTSTWLGLYRLTSDLHANVLSMLLVFAALTLFIRSEKFYTGRAEINKVSHTHFQKLYNLLNFSSKKPIYETQTGSKSSLLQNPGISVTNILIASIVIISSFTHFEDTSYFIVIFLISIILFRKKSVRRVVAYMVIPLIPSAILYSMHYFNPAFFPPGITIAHTEVTYEFLISYLGEFWPLVLVGVVVAIILLVGKKFEIIAEANTRFFIIFVMVWLTIGALIFRFDHYFPSFFSYSYRASTFLPVPLISTIPFFLIRHPRFQKVIGSTGQHILWVSIIMIFAYLNLTYSIVGYALPTYNISYISNQEYQTIRSLQSLHFSTKPIFVFYANTPGVSAGGMSEYPDRWISVFYGDHYTYLGLVNNLINARPTLINDSSSAVYSFRYIQDMKRDKIWEPVSIRHHPIIVLKDFYSAEPVSSSQRFKQIATGVYEFHSVYSGAIYSMSSLRTENSVYWGLVNRDIGNNTYQMLESYVAAGSVEIFNFTLPLAPHECYSLNMKYLEGSKQLGFDVVYSGHLLSSIIYRHPGQLSVTNINFCPTTEPATLSVVPVSAQGVPALVYFVSINDNLQVMKAPHISH